MTKKQVKEAVAKLKIQVNNLCQFLPQDRVVAFAQLTPPLLLRETEKAVGSKNMFELHSTLIELQKNEKDLEVTTREHQKHLEDLKQHQKSVERDVLRFQERQKWLNRVSAFLQCMYVHTVLKQLCV